MVIGRHVDCDHGSTTVTVVNESGSPVDIFWINEEGEHIRYYENVAQGTQVEVQTYVGHNWLVRQGDVDVKTFRARHGAPTERIEGACSGNTVEDNKATVTVVNSSGHAIDVFWINDTGEKIRYYQDVPHGTQVDVETYVGHRWLVRHGDDDVQNFTAKKGSSIVRIEGECAPEEEDTDGYHTRGAAAIKGGRIPICAFPCVDSEAVNVAARVIESMLQDSNEELCARLIERNCTLAVIGRHQVTSDMPPHSFLKNVKTADGRCFDAGCRGVGGTCAVPCTSVAEENVLMAADDRYWKESIQVHEFAHCVHNCGFSAAQSEQLQAAYDAAVANGGHGDTSTYMMSNVHEYWAEMTQAWFSGSDRTDVNNGINQRSQVLQRDQLCAQLLKDVYGEGSWRYTSDCPNPSKWTCRT